MDSISAAVRHLGWRALLVALGISCLTLLYTASACVYNIFLHPLRKFPGPPLARVSKLWSRIGNFYGCKSQRIHQAHLQYGSVVRVGPNELSFADPRAVRDIYTSDVFVKEETFYRAKRIFHENHLMSTRNPQAHKQRRKLLQRGFSQASMLSFEENMTLKIQMMFDQWARRCSDGPIEVFQWSHWLAFDIVYHLMFDEDPGSVAAGQPPALMPYVRAWRPTYIYKELVPQLEQWGPYVPGYIGGYFRKVQTWKKYAVGIIQDCRKRETSTPFLRNVLQGEKDTYLNRELTDSELAEECMGGMFGGSGTTANTFVFLLWACLRDPDIVARLKAELTEAIDSPTAIPDNSTCSSLPYLQAVIAETLRLYPTIIATLPRTVTQPTTIDGVHIPKGTIVGSQNYTVHRNEAAFPDAESFRPERWLQSANESAMKEAWVPFSMGTRKCIGINLAQMELNKMVASFFRRFDAQIDSSMTNEQMAMYDAFSASPAGGKLLVCMRESKE